MFPVRGGGLSIYTEVYGVWVGNFHENKNTFGKKLHLLIYLFIYLSIYLFVLKPEKIQSDISIFEGLAYSLLLTKIESDLNFIWQVIKHREF